MTVDEAVTTLRELQWSADEGWPFGWHAVEVASRAGAAVCGIERYVESLPDGQRAESAHAIRVRIEARYRATVPPRRRRTA